MINYDADIIIKVAMWLRLATTDIIITAGK